jgi:hypothetical protein
VQRYGDTSALYRDLHSIQSTQGTGVRGFFVSFVSLQNAPFMVQKNDPQRLRLKKCQRSALRQPATPPWIARCRSHGISYREEARTQFNGPHTCAWSAAKALRRTFDSASVDTSEFLAVLYFRQYVIVSGYPYIESGQEEDADDEVGQQSAHDDDGEWALEIGTDDVG